MNIYTCYKIYRYFNFQLCMYHLSSVVHNAIMTENISIGGQKMSTETVNPVNRGDNAYDSHDSGQIKKIVKGFIYVTHFDQPVLV